MVTGRGKDGMCQGMGTCVPVHMCGRSSWVVVTSGLREHRGSLCRKGPKQLPEPSSLVNLKQYRKLAGQEEGGHCSSERVHIRSCLFILSQLYAREVVLVGERSADQGFGGEERKGLGSVLAGWGAGEEAAHLGTRARSTVQWRFNQRLWDGPVLCSVAPCGPKWKGLWQNPVSYTQQQ